MRRSPVHRPRSRGSAALEPPDELALPLAESMRRPGAVPLARSPVSLSAREELRSAALEWAAQALDDSGARQAPPP